MARANGGLLVIVLAVISGWSCAKKAVIDAHLVFVPFESVGPAAGSEWMGVAVASIAAARTTLPIVPTIRDAQFARARQIVQGYVDASTDSVRVTATVRDENAQSTIGTFRATGKNVLDAAGSLARQIKPVLQDYSSSNPQAVQQLFTGHPDAAIAADPNYGPAHVAAVELLAAQGKRDDIPAAVARARAAKLSPGDQARLDLIAAVTPNSRAKALFSLAETNPSDVQTWRLAAEAALIAKDYKAAVEALRKATEIEPSNVVVWNLLGYAQTFAGDLESGKKSIAEYQRLRPNDANAIDSLGELYFYEGRFADAEARFLEAFEKNKALLAGGDLYRAALSRYLAGDRGKADDLFRKYIEFRQQQKDPMTSIREAVWLYTTGRRVEARQAAEKSGPQAGRSQMLIWDLVEGKGNPAILGQRPEVQGWRLLSARRYPEAVEYWKRIYDGTSPAAGSEARVMLAWALAETGRKAESQALLKGWPLPPAAPDPGFASIYVAKAIELKAGAR